MPVYQCFRLYYKMLYKEGTGFEPVHHITAARRISSPVHYHSANLPQVLFLNFSHEMSSLFLTDK